MESFKKYDTCIKAFFTSIQPFVTLRKFYSNTSTVLFTKYTKNAYTAA